MHGKLHAHALMRLMHAERAKQHITASLRDLIYANLPCCEIFFATFLHRRRVLGGSRADFARGHPVKELSEGAKFDNDKKVVICRRMSEKEERARLFAPSFKAVARSGRSNDIAAIHSRQRILQRAL